jgi:tricorn protease
MLRSTFKRFLCLTLGSALCISANAAQADDDSGTRMLRYADIHKDKVTFVYAGDIYVADIQSGNSTRLTSHIGMELFPKFSRDGSKIAFSAEYSGSRQVYVMNTDGSEMKQLTYYNDVGPMPPRGGFDYRILDWSADDQHVLVRANRLPWGVRMGRPMLVPVNGGLEQYLAVPETGGGMLSGDGKSYIYTPIDREFRTWKRTRGGRAQDVWSYDLENNTSKQLTTHPATDNQPVWLQGDIYFASDRQYTLNLFKYVEGTSPEKITDHDDYDVLWVSAGPDALVYEAGGYLWRYAPGTQATQLNIKVQGNREHLQATFKDASENIDSLDIARDGKRAVFAARGELFTVPAEHGEIRNISNTPEHREISVTWSPDGKRIAYLSDASGEYEIYTKAQSGKGEATQVTKNGNIWRFEPVWSPNSRSLAYADKNQTLWIIQADGKREQKVDRATRNDITYYRWSPDSRWLTYTKVADNGMSSIYVYDTKEKSIHQMTLDNTSEANPVFSRDGQYLFFTSERDYNLSFSSYEFNYLYNRATRVYAMALTKQVPPIYPMKSDEVASSSSTEKGDENEKDNAKSDVKVLINFDQIASRVMALNGDSADYSNLAAGNDGVFALRSHNGSNDLVQMNIKEDEAPKVVASSISNFMLSQDGKKLLVASGGDFAIVDAKPEQDISKSKLDLSDMHIKVDPKIEWQQMYDDALRIARDWFYDPNLHGMDWDLIEQRYQPMIDAASHRTDIDYALGEVGGELNAGHVYVQSGDQPSVPRIDGGLLGAELSLDKSGSYRIEKIFKGENWHSAFRSPLTEIGVNASEGDYIIAINGRSVRDVSNIYELLENTVAKQTTLTLSKSANGKKAFDTVIRPISSETSLRYLDWVTSRAAMVNKLSNGRIGYIHLPNTAVPGNRELFKHFLPQITKDALIIDDRYNGGGFIPDRMMELLGRKTLNYWKRRGLEPNATPFYAHDGPKVMLTNGYSSSGGDALPWYFRKLGLGKIIGTRTWGGLIGISGAPALVDGGVLLPPTFRIMDTDGTWVVENEGVTPDIEVIDRPELIYKGQDPSIERAVLELMDGLQENPRKSIKAPPAPTEF